MDTNNEQNFRDEEFEDDVEYEYDNGAGRSIVSSAAGLITAAAVGAGVALLFTTETGRDARDRVVKGVKEFDIPEKAKYVREAAEDGYEFVRRGGRRKKSNSTLYAILGTIASAAVAAALSPETTRKAGRWVGDTAKDVKRNASTRWEEYRSTESPMSPSTADAIRRLDTDGDLEPAMPGTGSARRRSRTPASASANRGTGARPEQADANPEPPSVA